MDRRIAGGQPRLNVTATPSFAIKWLVPRLNKFLDRMPDVDVRIDSLTASRCALVPCPTGSK